jgi:hypothetical protein
MEHFHGIFAEPGSSSLGLSEAARKLFTVELEKARASAETKNGTKPTAHGA